MTRRHTLSLVAAALVALSACGSADDTAAPAETTGSTAAAGASGDTMTSEPMTSEPMTTDTMTSEPMTSEPMTSEPMTSEPMTSEPMTSEPMAVDLAAWQTLEITDVNGETFTIADLAGRPVFVENFATWCSNCRKQLGDTNAAAQQLGDSAVFVALSVETELDASDVSEYAADNGFDAIRFAVMTPEMLAAMVDAFGNSAVNPPSTPHVIVAADGTAGEMSTGFISPDDIVSAAAAG